MGRKPCCDKVGLKKGPWTADEDRKLINFMLTNGVSCWRTLPKQAGLLRCGKSCRLRWTNYLRPDLKRGLLSEYEENMVINLHSQLGNKWSKIASHLPGRTDNEIKNHWNTHIKKKLRKNGIDPLTHTPLPPPTEKSQEQENQNSSNMDQNRQTEKCIDSIIIQEDDMQSILEAPTMEVMNNGFCTDEVPLIESHEILFSNSSAHYNSSSSTTTSSSNTNVSSLLEDLESLPTSYWLNGDDSTSSNIGFSWDMDDGFSNSDFLINDIDYDRIIPPTAHDYYDFSRLIGIW